MTSQGLTLTHFTSVTGCHVVAESVALFSWGDTPDVNATALPSLAVAARSRRGPSLTGPFDALGAVELARKPPEPAREQQQLVDFVRRHLHAVCGIAEDLAQELIERRALGLAAGRVQLGAYASATDHIHPILSVVPRNGIEKRKRLHREAQPAKTFAQGLEPVRLVTIGGSAFEFEPRTARGHFRSEHLDRAVIRAIEEGPGQSDALHVLGGRAGRDARAEALPYLVTQAPWRTRRKREQLRLIGEAHLFVERAIAQSEHVGQLPQRFLDCGGPEERAVIQCPVVVPGPAHHGQSGRDPTGELDEA